MPGDSRLFSRRLFERIEHYLAGGGGGGGWSCCQATPRAAGSVGVCSDGADGVDGELVAEPPGFLSADLSGFALSDGSFGPWARIQSAFRTEWRLGNERNESMNELSYLVRSARCARCRCRPRSPPRRNRRPANPTNRARRWPGNWATTRRPPAAPTAPSRASEAAAEAVHCSKRALRAAGAWDSARRTSAAAGWAQSP